MDFLPRPPPVRLGLPIIGHRLWPMQHNIYSRALTGVRVRIIEQPAGPYFTSPILKARTLDLNRPRAELTPPETATPLSHSRPRARGAGAFRVVAVADRRERAAATAKTNPPAGGDDTASFPSGVAAGTRSSQPLFCELNP